MRALLIGNEPPCDLGYTYVKEAPFEAVVIGSLTISQALYFTCEEALDALDSGNCGMVLRAKGIVAGESGEWIHFDYVPGEGDVRIGSADVIGRLCVIGAGINEEKLAVLFGI